MEGFISLLLDARTDFFIAHDKRYAMFAGSSEEDNNCSKLKRKEIICAWENTGFIIGQIKRITTIPGREKKAHSQFDWKISKTDHVRLAANVFVCNLDREKGYKASKEAFSFEKNILFLTLVSSSRIFHELHPADGILVLDNERLALIGGHRERLERR